MQRTDSFEKILMLGKIKGRRRRGWQRIEMVRWHHRLDGHEFEQALRVGDGQGSLGCCSLWGHKSWTPLSDWTEPNISAISPALVVKHKSTKSTKDHSCLYDGLLDSWIWFSSTSIILIHPCDFVKVKWKLCIFDACEDHSWVSRWLSCKKICLPNRRCRLILGLGRFPGGGNGNPLQYSYLENPMDREAWWAAVHGVTDSWIWLSDWAHTQRWLALMSLKVFKNIVLPWIYVFIHNILECKWQVSILFLNTVT